LLLLRHEIDLLRLLRSHHVGLCLHAHHAARILLLLHHHLLVLLLLLPLHLLHLALFGGLVLRRNERADRAQLVDVHIVEIGQGTGDIFGAHLWLSRHLRLSSGC
jgi:hypothetical protein